MITLENWRERMRANLQLRNYRQRTQSAYELATRLFLDWAKSEPGDLTEEHVRAYFLFLREQKKQAPSSINVAICALRFFCIHTLRCDWPVFELLRVNKPRMLGEGLRLETAHVDAERLMVWVRDGKGAKDRGVSLPRPLLSRLRRYWMHERPPSPTRFFFVPPSEEAPLHETTLQKTFTAAHTELRLSKHASIHTLRYSYATHLLEAGISLRTIQAILGHKALRTTEIYLHVTQPGVERVQDVLDRLMLDL